MLLLHTPEQMRTQGQAWRKAGHSLALVPTMGFLHQGHLSLVQRAAELADKVVVSIFVNPSQFGPQEDLDKYPRDLERDQALLIEQGAQALFLPTAELMYPEGFDTWVESPGLSGRLCGLSRPVHFRGVCTVVLKLLNIIRPEVAVFGEKDWQQLCVLRRLAADLNLETRLEGAPLVREGDGLAMSSRNAYLSVEERALAPRLYQGLKLARSLYQGGERRSAVLRRAILDYWSREFSAGRVEYLHIIDGPSLEEREEANASSRAIAAVHLGRTRLIDNLPLAGE